MTMSDLCQTCHKPHPWPDGTTPRHPFNPGTLAGSQALGVRPGNRKQDPHEREAVQPPVPAWPFDPVLRQALIDKGVLTPDDMRAAEDKIRAVTSQFERNIDAAERGTEDRSSGA